MASQAKSWTVLKSYIQNLDKIIEITVTVAIQTRVDGTAFVILGKKWIISIVRKINHIVIIISKIGIQTFWIVSIQFIITVWSILNCSNWAKNITIASQFKKPKTTDWGIKEVNFQTFKNQRANWIIQIKTTVANKYSSQYVAISGAKTMEIAAVDELIIQGLQVKIAATKAIIKAVWRLRSGVTQATKAKATASGIRASATVIQAKESFLKKCLFLFSFSSSNFIFI